MNTYDIRFFYWLFLFYVASNIFILYDILWNGIYDAKYLKLLENRKEIEYCYNMYNKIFNIQDVKGINWKILLSWNITIFLLEYLKNYRKYVSFCNNIYFALIF